MPKLDLSYFKTKMMHTAHTADLYLYFRLTKSKVAGWFVIAVQLQLPMMLKPNLMLASPTRTKDM